MKKKISSPSNPKASGHYHNHFLQHTCVFSAKSSHAGGGEKNPKISAALLQTYVCQENMSFLVFPPHTLKRSLRFLPGYHVCICPRFSVFKLGIMDHAAELINSINIIFNNKFSFFYLFLFISFFLKKGFIVVIFLFFLY